MNKVPTMQQVGGGNIPVHQEQAVSGNGNYWGMGTGQCLPPQLGYIQGMQPSLTSTQQMAPPPYQQLPPNWEPPPYQNINSQHIHIMGNAQSKQGNAGHSKISKKKRRSKFEQSGRSYACGCGKRYLSYPALYTHVKTKHSGVHPSGTNTPSFYNGEPRARGRPKKEESPPGHLDIHSYREWEQQKPLPIQPLANNYEGANPDVVAGQVQDSTLGYINIIKHLGGLGGPTSPTMGFVELIETDEKNKTDYQALLTEIENLISDNNKTRSGITVNIPAPNMRTCDRIMAEFLVQTSAFVHQNFYRTLQIFLMHYRKCINQQVFDIHNDATQGKLDPLTSEYSTQYNAEFAPEISNYFIKTYIGTECQNFELGTAIKLTMLISEWLYQHQFTRCKLALLPF